MKMPLTVHVGFDRLGPRASQPTFEYPGADPGGPEEARAAKARGVGGAAVPEHPALDQPGPAGHVGRLRPPARSEDLLRRDAAGLGAVLDGGSRLLVRAPPPLVGAPARLQAAEAPAQRVRAAAHLLQRAARRARGGRAAPPHGRRAHHVRHRLPAHRVRLAQHPPVRRAALRRTCRRTRPSRSPPATCWTSSTCATPRWGARSWPPAHDTTLRPEPIRRPLGGGVHRRRPARRDARLGRRAPPRFAAATPRHLRDAGRRRSGHRAHHAGHAAGQSRQPPSDRHRVVHRDDRRAGARPRPARLGNRRHGRAAGGAASGPGQGAGERHAAHARAARRRVGRGRRRAPGPAAAPPSGADLDRGGRAAHAAHGRRRRRRRLHPGRHSRRQPQDLDRRHSRRRRRGRPRSGGGPRGGDLPHRA